MEKVCAVTQIRLGEGGGDTMGGGGGVGEPIYIYMRIHIFILYRYIEY